MTTDADILRIIAESLAAAPPALAQLQPPFLFSSQEMLACSTNLRKAMDAHPEFSSGANRFFLGKQLVFFNNYQAPCLLYVAQTLGPEGSLAWLRDIRSVRSASMRVVGEVQGLLVSEPYTFSNGVTLLPLHDLPISPSSLILRRNSFAGLRGEFPSAAVIELDEVKEDSFENGYAGFQSCMIKLRRTIEDFALSENSAPTVRVAWQEFAEPKFHPAEFGFMWANALHEGRLPTFPVQIDAEMLEWVERYLALNQDVADFCHVPIQRLNLARRRVGEGDKAIDGCVCLEALLSGKDTGELTHRLATRTALLLKQDLDGRMNIAERIRKFYRLRSKAVHGSLGGKEAANRMVAEDGLSLCLSALRAVVSSGVVPQPEQWELTGGPPWNRFDPGGLAD